MRTKMYTRNVCWVIALINSLIVTGAGLTNFFLVSFSSFVFSLLFVLFGLLVFPFAYSYDGEVLPKCDLTKYYLGTYGIIGVRFILITGASVALLTRHEYFGMALISVAWFVYADFQFYEYKD